MKGNEKKTARKSGPAKSWRYIDFGVISKGGISSLGVMSRAGISRFGIFRLALSRLYRLNVSQRQKAKVSGDERPRLRAS